MEQTDVLKIIKKKKVPIPKSRNLAALWNIIAPVVVKEIAPDYLPISNLIDTNAYEIGNIFVQTEGQPSCFGSSPLLKVLGPIRDYVKKSETDRRWLAKEFPVVTKCPEHKDFQVILQSNGNELFFEGEKYYFLSKPDDMVLERNVTIDRTSDEDIHCVNWFGLIRDVVVTETFQLKFESEESGRHLYICDRPHVVLFNYEIYKLDSRGRAQNTSCSLPNLPWEGLQCECKDGLPLSTL